MKENFLLPIDDDIARENIRRYLSPAEMHKNVFTNEELEYIWKSAFKTENKPRLNRNGTVIITGENGQLLDIFSYLRDKVVNLLGEAAELSPSIGGNWFITPQQYGLHNDSIRKDVWEKSLIGTPYVNKERKYTIWKNIIIPLWIGTHFDFVDGGQFLFFDQRHIEWSTVYNAGNVTPNIASVYEICDDYSDLQFYDKYGKQIDKVKNKIPFDKSVHKKFVNTPIERLQGLTLEAAFDWEPGNLYIFDCVQLHASNSGTKLKNMKTWNSKMGLLLTFIKELDPDLQEQWHLKQANYNVS